MSRILRLFVVGLLVGACVSSSPPPPVVVTYTLGHFPAVPTGSFSSSTAGKLQAVLGAAVKKGLPSITATVLTADGRAWSGAAGTGGVRTVQIRSQFAIASITKTVIAAEVMRLSEEGSLRLSDPVANHLPSGFHFDTTGITIENLLHMESGIPDPAPDNAALSAFYGQPADPTRAWTPEEVLASVPTSRSTPGDHYVYEDANYMLLGLVIQQTTGTSVATALRSGVLADPRVSSMVYQPEERPRGPLALPFGEDGGEYTGGGYLPSKAEASEGNGSGCMASDSEALALWGYLLFGGRLVSEHSLLAMTDFGDGFYGLGVFNQTKTGAWRGSGQAIGNGGWDSGGYSSALVVLPSKGIVISVMTNEAGDPKVLVFPVAEALTSSLQKQG